MSLSSSDLRFTKFKYMDFSLFQLNSMYSRDLVTKIWDRGSILIDSMNAFNSHRVWEEGEKTLSPSC